MDAVHSDIGHMGVQKTLKMIGNISVGLDIRKTLKIE